MGFTTNVLVDLIRAGLATAQTKARGRWRTLEAGYPHADHTAGRRALGELRWALTLKHAWTSPPSGEWSDDDYDVLGDGGVAGLDHEGGRRAGEHVVDVDAGLWTS